MRRRRLAPFLVAAITVAPGLVWADDASEEPAAPPVPIVDQLRQLQAEVAAQRVEIDTARRERAALKATSEAALDAAAAPAASTTKEPTFRIFGFIDMGFQKLWTQDDPVVPTTKSTFVLGNINLYFDFHPTDDWSSLVEVRFTNAPNGAESFGILGAGNYQRTDTSVPDPANGPGYDTVKWDAIVIERAYIQWQHREALGVRVGQFLTPYGIWNVDHGTPTLISAYRPAFVSDQMWPSHQLGVEVFGRFDDVLPNRWSLEYHGYVSNGRTPGTVDLTEDKMLGARLLASTTRPFPMAFGVSMMTGDYADQEHDLDPATGIGVRPTLVAYHETGVALDASIDLGPLRLRSELATRYRTFTPGQREMSWQPGVYLADGAQGDAYVLAAYRIPKTRFEPYGYVEGYRNPSPQGDLMAVGSVGLNTYLTPAIQLKVQYSHKHWTSLEHFAFVNPDDPAEHFLAVKLVMGL